MITHVSIKVSNGGYNLVEMQEFVEMPLKERMSLLTNQRISFLDEDGQKVPLIQGVKYANDLIKNKK